MRRDTGGRYRIFTIDSPAIVSLTGLTITNGSVLGDNGGGIWNAGTLTLTDCVVSDNVAERSGTPSGLGGGIYNAGGTLVLSDCAVSGNSADGAGGGIAGAATLTNSTVSGNTAGPGPYTGAGGGIAGGPFTLISTIIAGIRATIGAIT